jgi:Arc/MetJ-type ribon-helix-helix transcriptional regulator
MSGKQRLSASVDADLIQAAEDAVAHGRFVSVSAWVNEALRLKLAHERRLEALAAFVARYERDHGEITAEEIEQAARRARGRAVPVRQARTVTIVGARNRRKRRGVK